MSFVAYVDVSAKIEQWTKDSVIAFANGKNQICLVRANVKQRIRRLLMERYDGHTIKYRIFTALIFLVVKDDLDQITQLVIDKDYSGAQVEATIKNFLLTLLRRNKPTVKAGFIRFEHVKGLAADRLARSVYQGVTQPTRVIGFEEIWSLLNQ